MRRLVGLVVVLVFAAVGCGGGGDDAGVSADTTPTVSKDGPTSAADTSASDDGTGTGGASDAPVGELPDFAQDFDRVCTSQVGYAGATAFDASGAAPHPVVVFVEDDVNDGQYITSGATLPDGWQVVEDSNFEDNRDLATAQLVACANKASTTPNGTTCDFDNDGETLTLNLVDASYELVVYEAATGTEVGRTTVEAATTDCPFMVFVDEGQTDYVNTPTADALTVALKPFVAP
jgi:hypothetical protein